VKNRQSTAAFALCVMGIINSQLSNATDAAEAFFRTCRWAMRKPNRVLWKCLTNRSSAVPGATRCAARAVRAFAGTAGPELRPVIDYWEPNYLAMIASRG